MKKIFTINPSSITIPADRKPKQYDISFVGTSRVATVVIPYVAQSRDRDPKKVVDSNSQESGPVDGLVAQNPGDLHRQHDGHRSMSDLPSTRSDGTLTPLVAKLIQATIDFPKDGLYECSAGLFDHEHKRIGTECKINFSIKGQTKQDGPLVNSALSMDDVKDGIDRNDATHADDGKERSHTPNAQLRRDQNPKERHNP